MNVWILYERDPCDDAPWTVKAVYTSEARAKEDETHLDIDQMQNNKWCRTKYYVEEHKVTE